VTSGEYPVAVAVSPSPPPDQQEGTTARRVCKWCRQPIKSDPHADYGVTGVDNDPFCEERVEGCLACEDGEPHPHQATGESE
jgi:hypothetical protein